MKKHPFYTIIFVLCTCEAVLEFKNIYKKKIFVTYMLHISVFLILYVPNSIQSPAEMSGIMSTFAAFSLDLVVSAVIG